MERLLRWFLVFGLVLAQTFAAPVEARDAVPVETLWHIHAIEIAPGTPTRLYLATHQGVLLAGMDGFAERISAITDDFHSFARHPRLPNVFYASVSTGTGAYPAVMISDNGARTWSWLSKVMVDDRSVAFDTLTISAVDPDVLYGAATSLYISRDGGRSWSAKDAPFEPIFDLGAVSPDAGQRRASDRAVGEPGTVHKLCLSRSGNIVCARNAAALDRCPSHPAILAGDHLTVVGDGEQTIRVRRIDCEMKQCIPAEVPADRRPIEGGFCGAN